MKAAKILTQWSTALVAHSAVGETTAIAKAHATAAEVPTSVRTREISQVTQAKSFVTATATVSVSNETQTFTLKTATPPEWDERATKRYSKLVRKEALDCLGEEEEIELEMLHRLKRQQANPPSGEELLARYRQEKLDHGMAELLDRYVNIDARPNSSQGSTA